MGEVRTATGVFVCPLLFGAAIGRSNGRKTKNAT
jgi:hypothetical protein